ncbi:Self-incompatibility protein S1, partial [Cucurbita argyrosperma subsp. argyrosperma]
MIMKILVSILMLILFPFFTVFMSLLPPEQLYGIEYEVRVINGFTNNSSLPLVIWCASKDCDIGGRALQEHDDFSWPVRTNFWITTTSQFSCTVKLDRTRKSFDAFKVPRDIYRCSALRKCTWLVLEDGFYFSDDEVNWKKDFSW